MERIFPLVKHGGAHGANPSGLLSTNQCTGCKPKRSSSTNQCTSIQTKRKLQYCLNSRASEKKIGRAKCLHKPSRRYMAPNRASCCRLSSGRLQSFTIFSHVFSSHTLNEAGCAVQQSEVSAPLPAHFLFQDHSVGIDEFQETLQRRFGRTPLRRLSLVVWRFEAVEAHFLAAKACLVGFNLKRYRKKSREIPLER